MAHFAVRSRRTRIAVLAAALIVSSVLPAMVATAADRDRTKADATAAAIDVPAARTDERANAAARWRVVESVLTHPRCLNCHTSTEYPRQGDDRHRHLFRVLRGSEGKGVAAAQCLTCHQATNQTSSGVPGAVGWHLAPLSMAWERAPGVAMKGGALCRRLLDRSRNGGMTLEKLNEHMAAEPLVLWAWAPGTRADGTQREPPPASQAGFLQAFRGWTIAGAPCPP